MNKTAQKYIKISLVLIILVTLTAFSGCTDIEYPGKQAEIADIDTTTSDENATTTSGNETPDDSTPAIVLQAEDISVDIVPTWIFYKYRIDNEGEYLILKLHIANDGEADFNYDMKNLRLKVGSNEVSPVYFDPATIRDDSIDTKRMKAGWGTMVNSTDVPSGDSLDTFAAFRISGNHKTGKLIHKGTPEFDVSISDGLTAINAVRKMDYLEIFGVLPFQDVNMATPTDDLSKIYSYGRGFVHFNYISDDVLDSYMGWARFDDIRVTDLGYFITAEHTTEDADGYLDVEAIIPKIPEDDGEGPVEKPKAKRIVITDSEGEQIGSRTYGYHRIFVADEGKYNYNDLGDHAKEEKRDSVEGATLVRLVFYNLWNDEPKEYMTNIRHDIILDDEDDVVLLAESTRQSISRR